MGTLDNFPASLDASNLSFEEGSFSLAAGSNGTQTVSFSNEYSSTAANAGPDVTGALLGSVSAKWTRWTKDADGNITGMDVTWENSDTASHTAQWSVFGVVR